MALSKITNTGIGTVDNITFSNGNGIDFSASAGGGASSSILDDYEQGTWTAEFADAASGGNVSSTAPIYANYVKVGSIVHINCRFNDLSTAGLTSGLGGFLTGLPFVASGESVGSVWRQSITAATEVIARVGNGTSYIRFDRVISNSADATILISDFTSGAADFSLSITYTTNA